MLGLFAGFRDKYKLKVLFPAVRGDLLSFSIDSVFMNITKKMGFGDALVCYIANMYAGQLDFFISWNVAHFRKKLHMDVMTPSEVLEALSLSGAEN